ncbi:hypothetical protein CO661_29745 [Sinorhizobium fredii]|uniref:Uncharacterized protein n=1 Tax=Rhizobium fredii TaxID=380 RepID=A0A2A6LPY9_RHIFR|nr:hypothetical protein CO661_29745 [Sinorhizobium fredii]
MAFPLNAPAFKPLAAAQGWARSEAVSGEMARNNWPFDPFTAGCSIGTPTSETVSAPQPHI